MLLLVVRLRGGGRGTVGLVDMRLESTGEGGDAEMYRKVTTTNTIISYEVNYYHHRCRNSFPSLS